jgi:cell division protein FtsL
MSRLVTVGTVLLAVGSAFVLYATSYETRRLELHVGALARTAEKTSLDIAVLRAERAYLARPDRIESLARKAGLGPIEPRQYEMISTAPVPPSTSARRQP